MKNIIFSINGGLGKCIAATAVCSAVKKKYPESNLIVISGYPDVFINNPNVDKSLMYGHLSYFYTDYIEGKDFKLMLLEPYATTDYALRNKHIIQIWCELNDLPYNNEQPEFYLTQREIEYFTRQVNVEKPILLMQTNGGADINKKYSWARDLPPSIVMTIIEEFKNNYEIFHVRREDQQEFPFTTTITANIRQIACISKLSKKRLVIDSFLQHTLGALNLPAVACWVVNSPIVFGYDMHTHIMCNEFTKKPELKYSFTEKFNIGGDEIEFPYNNQLEIFDAKKIIESLYKI